MKIIDCKANHLTNPLGYLMDKPVFSYVVTDSKGKKQTQARICLSLDADMKTPIFDTGLCTDIDSLAYEADVTLNPRTRYFWTVTVHTDAGEEATSDVNWFETAKMTEPWQAKWITCDSDEQRHPVFYKELTIKDNIKSARLYICGLGLYEASINGEKIGSECMTPYCGNYHEWVQYQTYDVTNMLGKDNRLSVLLGNGWYKDRFAYTCKPCDKPLYGENWALIAELHVEYDNCDSEIFCTDESWQIMRSRILKSSIYHGEHEDATLPDMPVEQVQLNSNVMPVLTERLSTAVTVHEHLPVKKIIYTPAGETVLDIGQNIAGIFSLRVNVPKGTKVYLQFGEVLQNGNFYRDNLRSALAEYLWISDGSERLLQPLFTFYGYRYVKIEGIPEFKAQDFTALALYSDIQPIGKLETGHKLVNQLISNTMWGQKGNFLDVPTDCPQRDERLGWTGDAQVFSPTALYLTDSYAFYKKYLYDISTEQKALNGIVPIYVPSFDNHFCSSVWGDVVCIIPWNLYVFSGDKSVLSESYESMKAWINHMTETDGDNHKWRESFHFGDWLALDHPDRRDDQVQGGTDAGFIADVYYMNSVRLITETARVLGKTEDAKHFDDLTKSILHWIRTEYFSETGRCCIDTQTAHLLTLNFGLGIDQPRIRNALKTSFNRVDNKLQTGFVGTPLLCNVLSANGMDDIAYHLLLNEDFPGWLHEIKLGATTVWERWNSINEDGSISSTDMNSLNHYAYGSIVEWMWRRIAGINPCEDTPGFRKVKLTPVPNWELKSAGAEYKSPAGTYKVSWHILDETHLSISVNVPFGCEAHLKLPFTSADEIIDAANPVFKDVQNGICILETGEYQVTYETKDNMKEVHSMES